MNAVLYTQDMQPITVVDISEPLRRILESGRMVRLPVAEPLMVRWDPAGRPEFSSQAIRSVGIFAERLVRRGVPYLLLFTEDEEHALVLRSELLPGQRGAVLAMERRAEDVGFAKGFLAALREFPGD